MVFWQAVSGVVAYSCPEVVIWCSKKGVKTSFLNAFSIGVTIFFYLNIKKFACQGDLKMIVFRSDCSSSYRGFLSGEITRTLFRESNDTRSNK